ncbi:hypothetical protein HMPREF1985_00409 [Mitsuokella sp. oral taxon 131 str. W9106]|nr:hypothetical protein HMPREF1985_00409 [Mitsuokella sp. oral taxon 131 str. W9106]
MGKIPHAPAAPHPILSPRSRTGFAGNLSAGGRKASADGSTTFSSSSHVTHENQR